MPSPRIHQVPRHNTIIGTPKKFPDQWAAGYPYSSAVTGATPETAYNPTNVLHGIANAWSVVYWMRQAASAATATAVQFQLKNTANANNSITFQILGAEAGDPANIVLTDSAGATFKDYQYTTYLGSLISASMHAITWDGTTLLYYINGVAQTPTVLTADVAGTMTDTARAIAMQCDVAGNAGIALAPKMIGVWNESLSEDAVISLWSAGLGDCANLRADFQQYTSKDALVHWYVPGRTFNTASITQTIGTDYAEGPAARPTNGATTTTVLVTDFLSGISNDLRSPNGAHLAFNTSEYLLSTAPSKPLGITNRMTWMTTFRPLALTAAMAQFDVFADGGSAFHQIRLQIEGNVANDPITLTINGSTGVIKSMQWNLPVSPTVNTVVRSGVTIAFTWDGPNNEVYMYRNGKNLGVANTITNDVNSSSRIDADSTVCLGARRDASSTNNAQVTEVACWNVALPADEIAFLYNEGYPLIDLNKDQLGYYSAGNLKHWWRFGQPAGTTYSQGGDICVDQVKTGGIDVVTSAVGLTVADVLLTEDTLQPGHSLAFTTWGGCGSSPRLLGIANNWSLFIYGVAGTTSNIQTIFQAGVPDEPNCIVVTYVDAASDYVNVLLYDSAGVLFKDYRFSTAWISSTPNALLFTWDGTNLVLYRNKIADSPEVLTVDNAGTMTDTARAVYVGRNHLNGDRFNSTTYISQIVLWNNAMAAAEAVVPEYAFLTCDLRQNSGSYQSSANIQHLWQFGADPENWAKDVVGGMHLQLPDAAYLPTLHAFRRLNPLAF